MKLLKKLGIAIFLVFLFFSLTKNIFDYKKTLEFYDSFKKDYEEERKKKISLQTKILKSRDVNEIEKTIRNKLNLLKPGEIAIIIPSPTVTPTPIPTPKPLLFKWLDKLFRLLKRDSK